MKKRKRARQFGPKEQSCYFCDRPFFPLTAQLNMGRGKFCTRLCARMSNMRARSESKICSVCKVDKPRAEFPRSTKNPDRIYSYCLPCKSAYMAAIRKKFGHDYNLNRKLTREFGITLEQYRELLAHQEGKCAICGTRNPGVSHKRMVIDHDHSTGKIRGLLCSTCNTGLGLFRDSPDSLRAAAIYLDNPPANEVL